LVLDPVVLEVSETTLFAELAETGDVESALNALAKAEATNVLVLLAP
jgi:hypothetical protein